MNRVLARLFPFFRGRVSLCSFASLLSLFLIHPFLFYLPGFFSVQTQQRTDPALSAAHPRSEECLPASKAIAQCTTCTEQMKETSRWPL